MDWGWWRCLDLAPYSTPEPDGKCQTKWLKFNKILRESTEEPHTPLRCVQLWAGLEKPFWIASIKQWFANQRQSFLLLKLLYQNNLCLAGNGHEASDLVRHNWSRVQRLFWETRGVSAALGILAWDKLLLTIHQNLLLKFTETAELIHFWLMGIWHPAVLQPPSALLTCVLGGILA